MAMSLLALVYNFRNPITSSADLVQIVNIGNNMYSALSQSCQQGLLFLTDLHVMVNLNYINYQFTYSDNYSGLLNSARPLIADFPNVISLLAAIDSLLMDNYHVNKILVSKETVVLHRWEIETEIDFIKRVDKVELPPPNLSRL